MRMTEQIAFHAAPLHAEFGAGTLHGNRVNRMVADTEHLENERRATVPTRPGKGRIAVHVSGVDDRPRIQQQPDGLLGGERGGAMQGRLSPRQAIPHEAARLDRRLRRDIRIGPRSQQHLDDVIKGGAVGGARRGMQGHLAGVGQGMVHIRAVFDEELTQPPVPMKTRPVEIEILPQ